MHVIFDNPGRQPNSPKSYERSRRDTTFTLSADHRHVSFSDVCAIPSKWRDHLSCRTCKCALVLYLGQSFLDHMPCLLRGEQKVIIAGCFQGVALDQAWEITSSSWQPVPCLC